MNERDTLYTRTLGDPGLFTFNRDVVSVFPDMIQRSVPGYSTVIAMTGLLAARHARPGTRVYDLGCSLGASLLAVADHLEDIDVELVGIDNSPAMLERCRDVLGQSLGQRPWRLIESDVTEVEYSAASVCILNYTLQFVPLAERPALLTRLRQAMAPGDALILSEKFCFDDAAMNRLMTELHHDFKRAQGYSDLEIARKRQALENVLLPESREAHVARLKACGFASAEVWFQCFNFGSLIAIA